MFLLYLAILTIRFIVIEFSSYDSLESAQERLKDVLLSIFYDSDVYKDLNDNLKLSLDDLIKIFDSKEYKISFISGNSDEELQSLIKAFMLYVNLKLYDTVYVSNQDNENMIHYIKKMVSQYHCKDTLCSIYSFVETCLGKIHDSTILIFDDIDVYTINSYMNTSMFGVSLFILVCNNKPYKM